MVDFINREKNPQKEVTPSLSECFKEAVNSALGETRVSMPAKIVDYDHKTQKATVQPVFKRKYKDGEIVDAPLIYNVPVAIQRAKDSFVSMPLEKGDSVYLWFSDRSLEQFLSSNAEHAPDDTRKHHLSDAVAYPGVYGFNEPAPVNNGSDVISKMEILK